MSVAAQKRLCVGIVEDEPRLRELLVREIIAMGHEATGFRTAEDAWPRIEQGDFDALMLDLNLPGMDGMELFRRVREKRRELAVVILTGFGGFDSAVQALRWRADDYLTKPCTLDQIERVLARLLVRKRRKLRGALAERKAAEVARVEAAPPAPAVPPAPVSGESLEAVEREHIIKVLQSCDGNKPEAAAALGISLRTLYNRLNMYKRQGRL